MYSFRCSNGFGLWLTDREDGKGERWSSSTVSSEQTDAVARQEKKPREFLSDDILRVTNMKRWNKSSVASSFEQHNHWTVDPEDRASRWYRWYYPPVTYVHASRSTLSALVRETDFEMDDDRHPKQTSLEKNAEKSKIITSALRIISSVFTSQLRTISTADSGVIMFQSPSLAKIKHRCLLGSISITVNSGSGETE